MIAYTMVGTRDLDRSRKFYEPLLAELEAKFLMGTDRAHFYGNGPGNPMFSVCTPYDGEDQTPGNGTMVALACVTPEQVQSVHAKALELGAEDEGAPGERGPGGAFYLAYFRDPDHNKIALFTPRK